ncbi:MAG: radical SAM protein [Candidatus Nanoarchaeia archaeon]|nr:radical SAM protein [Candidatus Nanoarchaeia archaeon]
MKRILLIAPLTEQYSGIRNYGVPSIGVHRLASFLSSWGNLVMVYDCNIDVKPKDFISVYKPLILESAIIGISILNDTLADSLEMFIKLRELNPDALLVAGGAEAILNYQEIFDNSDVNIVILGEGEEPMLQLCCDVPLQDIGGIITRSRGPEINNKRLWNYYKDIDFLKMGWRQYWQKNWDDNDPNNKDKIVRLVTSSHCNRGCSFCSLTRLHEFSCGKKVKPAFLSGEQIRVLIDRILEQLPETTHIYFVEDSILPTISRIHDFCSALAPYKDRLKFMVQTETDKVSRDIIKELADAGVIHISFGVENCSPRIRKLMHKPQNEEKIENIITWCNEFNIRCYYLIILFSPESTIEDLRINYETLTRWQTEGKVTVSVEPFMMPYKGADIYYQDYEFGYNITKLSNGKVLKHPYIIYPKDHEVKKLMLEFKKQLPGCIDKFNDESGHRHRSKDHTGKVMVKLLGDLLNNNLWPEIRKEFTDNKFI